MRITAVSGSISVTLLAVLMGCARADVIPPCASPDGVRSTSLRNGAPPAMLRALKEHVGEIVPRGATFDATDVVVTGQSREIFVWNAGRRWVVATEHGGRSYNDPIFAYDLGQDGRSASLVAERIAFPETVCATAFSLLTLGSQKP